MPTHSFHEGELPADFPLAFEPALFNTSAFSRFQAGTGWRTFYSLNAEERTVDAFVSLHVHDGAATSPLRAPFGATEVRPDIPVRALFDFIGYVENELRNSGVKRVILKCPPRAYNPATMALAETLLLNHGFTVIDSEVGAIIGVGEGDFAEGLAQSESLRRRQAMNAGLEFRMLSLEDLDNVYDFIDTCHRQKGYQMSMSLQELKLTTEHFPDRFVVSAVMLQDSFAAAGISIRVKGDVLYNFMINHEKRFNSLSPPILLMEGLYRYCQGNRIRLFDLGTSALDGKPNFSLLDFKLRMGARPTSKTTFQKVLH